MRRLLLALTILVMPAAAAAAPAPANPDWPCQQRLVPALTAGTFWSGPLPLPEPEPETRVAQAIAAAAPRDVPLDRAAAALSGFADQLSAADRAALLPRAFLGLVDAVNRQRSAVIGRIEQLTRRQRELGRLAADVTRELAAIPADATGEDAARRAEIVDRRAFVIRSFEETQRTMRYACEVPVELEARLGAFARLLQGRL